MNGQRRIAAVMGLDHLKDIELLLLTNTFTNITRKITCYKDNNTRAALGSIGLIQPLGLRLN